MTFVVAAQACAVGCICRTLHRYAVTAALHCMQFFWILPSLQLLLDQDCTGFPSCMILLLLRCAWFCELSSFSVFWMDLFFPFEKSKDGCQSFLSGLLYTYNQGLVHHMCLGVWKRRILFENWKKDQNLQFSICHIMTTFDWSPPIVERKRFAGKFCKDNQISYLIQTLKKKY